MRPLTRVKDIRKMRGGQFVLLGGDLWVRCRGCRGRLMANVNINGNHTLELVEKDDYQFKAVVWAPGSCLTCPHCGTEENERGGFKIPHWEAMLFNRGGKRP
jgi:hypothetical protein